ncbi:hypothetical protein BDA99DRAFT_513364 [Phascolomyces articulosus]|uniref:Uncharacterized protein n=1 Tax=Phascolomyces articulosus TaxID=60185 RepID=A0AAD5K7E6_9FUNG|nr:hypothetical protein BDA99DRAFT_513364 [Phascolomyces articulosus]
MPQYNNTVIATNKPKRIFNYFLSLIGLDRFIINPNDHDDDQYHGQLQKQPSSSSTSSCSFLTASTLIVSHHHLDKNDHDDSNKNNRNVLPSSDVWTLQSWIGGLSKSVLCQIVWMGLMRYHDSTYYWPELEQVKEGNGIFDDNYDKQEEENDQEEDNDVLQELKTIQEQANKLSHRLDTLRPSEQFAHAAQVAQEFQQLIRLCVHLLHENPFAAILGLILIVQQSFGAPPEVRQHIYYQAKLGRLVVLELESILKYHHHGNKQQQQQYQQNISHHANYLVSCAPFNNSNNYNTKNNSNDDVDEVKNTNDWLEQLEHLCAKLARYDTTWEFRQEYQNVVQLAEQFSSIT